MSEETAVKSEKETKKTFSFSKEADGVTRSISGREVENGWVIDINKSWTEKDDDGNDRYKNDYKTYISKDNPLDKIKDGKKEKKDDSGISGMLGDIATSMGMLIVD
jgi:hypothetical protein